jgi:hypothetical protein
MKWLPVVGVLIGGILLSAEIAGVVSWPNRQDEGPNVMELRTVTGKVAVARADPTSYPLDAWVVRISARPLFSSTRRPALVQAVRANRPAELPRLSGLISWPGGNYAIFVPEKSSHTVVVGEGATLGQWTVQNITADTVTIRHGEKRVVMHTSFDNAPSDPKSLSYSVANPLALVVPRANHFWAGRADGGIGGAGSQRAVKP